MPDPYKDEEIETRTLSLCLFDVASLFVLTRCAHCPGAARAALQHQRCPRETLQLNSFRPEDPDSKIRAALKSSASSSKQHESGHDDVDTALANEVSRLRLKDSEETAGRFGRSESDPNIPGSREELLGSLGISHGGKRNAKRKAKLEDREAKHMKNDIREYLKLKPQKPLCDLEPGNLFIPGCWRAPSDEVTTLLMNSSTVTPMDTQEDRPSRGASSSRLFVPGCGIVTELEGYGVCACDDGIDTEGCEELACCDEMEV